MGEKKKCPDSALEFSAPGKNEETKAIFTMASEFKAYLSYSKLFWHNAV